MGLRSDTGRLFARSKPLKQEGVLGGVEEVESDGAVKGQQWESVPKMNFA